MYTQRKTDEDGGTYLKTEALTTTVPDANDTQRNHWDGRKNKRQFCTLGTQKHTKSCTLGTWAHVRTGTTKDVPLVAYCYIPTELPNWA